jgi:cellulose biosynthesis protein BcsQ
LEGLTGDPKEVEGILLTMVEPNTRVTDLTIRQLQLRYGKHLFETSIPQNSTLSEASFYGKPAIVYGVGSKGATAYLTLANAIIAHQEGRERAAQPALNTPLQLVEQKGR